MGTQCVVSNGARCDEIFAREFMTTQTNDNEQQPESTSVQPTGGESSANESLPTTATTQLDNATAAPSEPNSPKSKIKIGTQRAGVVPPKIPPRTQTVFKTQPPAEPPSPKTIKDKGKPSEAAAPIVPAESAPVSAEEQPPVPVEAAAADASDTTTQLAPKPAPLAPSDIQKRPPFKPDQARIPRPNLRAGLSPDLEAELAESLGGMSLEEVLSADERGKQAAETIELESKVKAKVVRVHRDDVFVELPGMSQGVVSLSNFPEPPTAGTMLDAIVARFNADEGLYELIVPGGAVDIGDWSDIAEGITVDARITGHNKGGLECEVNHIRGFIPVSQVSIYRVEDLEQFVGQKMTCIVTEANRDRRNLVLSRRAVLEREQAEAKERLLEELAEGQEREGIVRNIRDFGAFVDLGGVDGMLHVSQLSWDRVKHPSDVLTLGQKIKVKIQKIDRATGKIGLSYRDTFESPWATAPTRYPVTSRVKGTVSKIMDFGAFVRLESGVEGLVHISELSHKRVFRVSDVVSEGQEVEAKVLSVDPEAQRMSLSMKALEARSESQSPADESAEEEPTPAKKPTKRAVPLKGGLGRHEPGDPHGLRW
jgi:predicted RNA-binding protein with RPS1 domain